MSKLFFLIACSKIQQSSLKSEYGSIETLSFYFQGFFEKNFFQRRIKNHLQIFNYFTKFGNPINQDDKKYQNDKKNKDVFLKQIKTLEAKQFLNQKIKEVDSEKKILKEDKNKIEKSSRKEEESQTKFIVVTINFNNR